MTRFEKDTLLTLLFMYEKELKNGEVKVLGEAISEEYKTDRLESIKKITSILSMQD